MIYYNTEIRTCTLVFASFGINICNIFEETMKVHELLSEAKRDPDIVRKDYQRWKKLVNMSSKTLEKFLSTPEGKSAGLSKKDAKKAGGIKTGRGSARAILKMRSIPFSEWSTEQVNWMYRQISFVSRMSGNEGPMFRTDKDGNKMPSRKLTSLWVWGHIPAGHPPSKYGVFK